VDHRRAGVEHGLDLLGEAAEVGGEDRGGEAFEHGYIGANIEDWQ
jgi:hypothetical protein